MRLRIPKLLERLDEVPRLAAMRQHHKVLAGRMVLALLQRSWKRCWLSSEEEGSKRDGEGCDRRRGGAGKSDMKEGGSVT